ncbi:homolog of RPW8 1 [Prunus dulcis]|uniref:Homolog of RPW8 1 n=1 Tax=Prunus dulcis TaxID=3755 RepID=A0A4Y1RVP0_PRUDU|nr:homolog of RPW8 1 [Prunus dulcis]
MCSIVTGMTVPAMYVKYQDKIEWGEEKLKAQLKRYYDMVDEKVVKKIQNKVTVREEKEKKVLSMEKILIDATIGRALEALLGAVSQARERAHMYESILAQLEFTIQTITPKISEIDHLSEEDFPDDVIYRIRLQLIQGRELVNKCSNAGCCNLWKSQMYYKKLQELEDSLRRLITIDLQVKVALDDDSHTVT